ncbi:hypothetical protein Hdeb2414_s0011g00368111 [Helianthus debilis subsp. tardiflorus]
MVCPPPSLDFIDTKQTHRTTNPIIFHIQTIHTHIRYSLSVSHFRRHFTGGAPAISILARGGACTPFSSQIYHPVTFRCRFTGFSTGGGVGVRTTVYRRRWWSL